MECDGDQEFMVEMAVSSPGQQEAVALQAAAVTTSPTAAPAAATTRPYYECVFCKRGFTTVQALGGHMNIHRRHRHHAKPPDRRDAPTATGITSTVSLDVECYNQHRNLAYPPPTPAPPPVTSPPMSSSFSTSYAGGTATVAGVDGESKRAAGGSTSHIRELSLLGGADTDRDHDLHLRLGRHGRGGDGSPRTAEGSPERKPDLDLELRLGRRPRH